MRKAIQFGILVVVLLIAGIKVYRIIHAQNVVAGTLISPHWLQRYNDFVAEPRTKNKIIFLGDSHTELFHLSVFNDSTIINRGISGDFSEGLLKRLDEVISLEPSKIFIEIGTNDLFEKIPISKIVRNFRSIIQQLKRKSPKAKIYIQSCLPVNVEGSFFTSNASLNKLINHYNHRLKELSVSENVTYIEIHDHFLKDNALDPALTWDGVHLNQKGYKVWAEILKPYIFQPN